MLRIVVAMAALGCRSGGSRSKNEEVPGDGGCPGWDPVVHFGGASTPAGGGMVGSLLDNEGVGVFPPFGGCYRGCSATGTTPETDAAHIDYEWNDDGLIANASIVETDRAHEEGMSFTYSDSGLLASLGYYEVNDGVRDEESPWLYTFDAHEELAGNERENHSTVVANDNVYSDGLLTHVESQAVTYGPYATESGSVQDFAWSDGRLTEMSGSEDTTTPECRPLYGQEVEYDESGRRTHEKSIVPPCGDLLLPVDVVYGYDEHGRLTSVAETRFLPSGNSEEFDALLSFDDAGRAAKIVTHNGTIDLTYDCPE